MNPSKLRYQAKLKRRAFLRMANHNLKMFGVPRNTQFLTAKQIDELWPYCDNSYAQKYGDSWLFRIRHICDGIMVITDDKPDEDLVGYFDKDLR